MVVDMGMFTSRHRLWDWRLDVRRSDAEYHIFSGYPQPC